MSVTRMEGGGVVVTGEHIELFRLLALKGALNLEIAGLRRSGRKASTIVRELLCSRTRDLYQLRRELQMFIETQFPPPPRPDPDAGPTMQQEPFPQPGETGDSGDLESA